MNEGDLVTLNNNIIYKVVGVDTISVSIAGTPEEHVTLKPVFGFFKNVQNANIQTIQSKHCKAVDLVVLGNIHMKFSEFINEYLLSNS